MRLWLSVSAVIAANLLMKAIGPIVVGSRPLPSTARNVIALMAPVLLAGLIVVELGGEDWADTDTYRLVGVAVAGLAGLLRAPMLLAVVCGGTTTALLRLQGGG